jgi:hypothetical protein
MPTMKTNGVNQSRAGDGEQWLAVRVLLALEFQLFLLKPYR